MIKDTLCCGKDNFLEMSPTDHDGQCSYCFSGWLKEEDFSIILRDKNEQRVLERWMCEKCFKEFYGEVAKISTLKRYKTTRCWSLGNYENRECKLLLDVCPEKSGYCSYCSCGPIEKEDFKVILNVGHHFENNIINDRWLCKNCFLNVQSGLSLIYNRKFVRLWVSPSDFNLPDVEILN